MKNLENSKTPPFDEVPSGNTKLLTKKQPPLQAENASHAIPDHQIKLSTPPKFKHHYNRDHFKTQYEKPSLLPSDTVPNQSMTITEIYSRYASGRPLSGVNSPLYDDDGTSDHELDFSDYMPDLGKLDLADRQEVLENAKMELDEVKKRLEGIASARKIEKDKKASDLARRLKILEQKETPPPAPSAGGDTK